ncbi:response regulator, partial [uncultured Sphingomonas sp.]
FFSTKGVGRGTGLGLSMAHGLAAQLGGALTIDSALGRGTRICLWLPECAAGGLSATSVEPSETPVFTGTAILVDDEDVVREATAQMLSDLGFRVRGYASAADALSAIDDEGEQAPGLVVSDQVMPGMTGAEFLGHVRARYPRVRTLLISGYLDKGDIDPAIPRLTKPFVKRDLAAALAVIR